MVLVFYRQPANLIDIIGLAYAVNSQEQPGQGFWVVHAG